MMMRRRGGLVRGVARTAVVAGTAYGLAPFFRMSIATAIATLDQGCARIATAVTALR